eukprot:scaffold17147_cov148-Skeletonema_marinoi.AAC.1
MNRHNNSRGNSHWRDRHSSNGSQEYNQGRGRLRYRQEENSQRSHSHHGHSRSHLNVNGKRSRSIDAKESNQVCARSEHRFENHSRGNGIRCEPHHMPQQPSWNDRPQQKQHPHNRPRYDHHMPQQPSWNDRPQQKQHPHNRPRYDHHMPQQPSWNARPMKRFKDARTAIELVQIVEQSEFHFDLSAFWNNMSKKFGKNQPRDDYHQDRGEMNRKLTQIFEITQREVPSYQSKDLSLTIHGIAKITFILKEGGSTRNRNCVEAALHSLLLDNAIHRGLFDTMANHIVALESMATFGSQSLANIVWAFAKVELLHQGLFDKVAHHIVSLQTLHEFKPQEIANTVWAYAKVLTAENSTSLHSVTFESNHHPFRDFA